MQSQDVGFDLEWASHRTCCIYPTPHQRKNVAQGLFKVGPVTGPEPTRIRQFQKCLGPRRHSPFLWRLRSRAIKPTPPKRVKAWRDGLLRPEELYPLVEHTRMNRTARNHSRSRSLQHWKQKKSIERAIFVCASQQTRLDTRSKGRRPIKVEIKGKGRLETSRGSNPADLCCSSARLVQCEPDEPGGFTGPNIGPGTCAILRFKLDARSSAVQSVPRRQKCSSPT